MKKPGDTMAFLRALLATLCLGCCVAAQAAPAQAAQPDWEEQVRQADAALWLANNTCDLALLKRTLSKEVEFYHDFIGVTTGNDNFIALMKRSVCKLPNEVVRRRAIDGTVRISILRKFNKGTFEVYGAVVQGEHSFTTSYDGEPEEDSGTGHFFNVLLLSKDGWKVARIVSYLHTPGKEAK